MLLHTCVRGKTRRWRFLLAFRNNQLEAQQCVLKVQQQLLQLVGRVLAAPLLLALKLSHAVDQRTGLLSELLLLCFQLLDILHQGDQLPGKRINLLETWRRLR